MNLQRLHPTTRAIAFALGWFVVAFGVGAGSRMATGSPPGKEPPPVVLPVQTSEVRRVVVESGDREVAYTRAPDGSWSAAGAPPGTADLLSEVEERLFPLGAYRSLRADVSAPEYGLVDPEISFRVEDAHGNERVVLLGAPTFTSGGVYARRGTEARRVYLVPRRMMDDLRSLLAGRRIDAPNDLAGKARELTEQAQAQRAADSWWLQQAVDAQTPLPPGLK